MVPISTAGSSRQGHPCAQGQPGGDKIVLCYMSIGQSETYRWYWDLDWEQNPPEWLDVPDGVWAGDHWVRYWHPDWQRIVYGTPEVVFDNSRIRL